MRKYAHTVVALFLLVAASISLAAPVVFDDTVTFKGDTIVKGGLNSDAVIGLRPDSDRTVGRRWTVEVEAADGDLTFNSSICEALKITTGGVVTVSGTLNATTLTGIQTGNGAGVTNINAANIAAGTVASAFNGASITNLNGANISKGNIPVATITNAAASIGPSIGGNIGVAAMTNVLGAVRYTGIVTNGGAGSLFTNILTYVGGICTAASLNP